jgi:pyruvate,water dikinase
MTGAPLVVGLAFAAGVGREQMGSKAATLAELAAAGFPVPSGFVVPAAAFAESEDTPEALDTVIAAAAAGFGEVVFAVRSSAGAEDLPDASYAGLYETYLNVPAADLPDAVRRCHASAATAQVSAYHSHQHVAADPSVDAGMAVLVQRMVDADAAGVAFTANPVTGDPAETVITAVRGLGERLVSGEAVGDQWVVRDGRAARTRDTESAIDAAQTLAVATLARRVADRYTMPQDIEWAIADGDVFLLQARAMTALPEPADWTSPGPGVWLRNFRLGEWLPEPVTPLFVDWLLERIETGFYQGMRGTVGASWPFPRAIVNGWYYARPNPAITPARLARALISTRGGLLRVVYPALVQAGRNPAAADRAVLNRLYEQWRDTVWPRYQQLVNAAETELETKIDIPSPERLREIVDQVAVAAGEHLWSLTLVGGAAWKMEGCLARFTRRHLTTALRDGPQVLLQGLPGAGAPVPGHAVHSIDWLHATIGELSPTVPSHAVPEDDRDEHDERRGRLADRLADRRGAAEQACRAALATRPKVLAQFDSILAVAQRYAVIREQQARDVTYGWPLLRRCVYRLGEQLAHAGAIDDPDDVFFLTRIETRSSNEKLHEVVADRRATWQRQRRMAAPLMLGRLPRLLGAVLHRGVEASRTPGTTTSVETIVGEPASPGRATAAVRVVRGPDEFAGFQPGEVLVAASTTPAWTPLFAHAAAVVTDGGTLAAHASLVAREYGIPAVVATGTATRQLHNGQLVTVDGSAGTVTPIHPTVQTRPER